MTRRQRWERRRDQVLVVLGLAYMAILSALLVVAIVATFR